MYKPLEIFTGRVLTQEQKDNINVKVKDDCYLYNYNDKHLVPRDDEIIMLCRGLVLNKNGFPLNIPFTRFFNSFEKECELILKQFDWDSAEIQEKVDGSLVNVWFNPNNGQWYVTTRGSHFPNNSDVNFEEEFKRLFNSFDMLDKNTNYMFELVTKKNRIITWYDEEFVVLLGARKCSNKELSQKELDNIANTLDVRRPKRYKLTDQNVQALFENLKDDDEGFVAVDKYFNRIKFKQESYIKLSKIRKLKEQDILDYVMGLTELDEEYLQKDKDSYAKYLLIKKQYNKLIIKVHNTYQEIKCKDRKEFALKAIQYPFKALLFCLKDDKPTPYIKWENFEKYIR